ncbi:MAG: pentapeptide repeat-containing protein [Actinomycetota bacterium]|nr:pentapeptide repeat-containing protein [Actinomycetota bacterium]MDA3019994.1 pentapeptide repeat-containing protein [Actinomycetota bacterium]
MIVNGHKIEPNANLSGEIVGYDLFSKDLSGVNLTGANLSGAILSSIPSVASLLRFEIWLLFQRQSWQKISSTFATQSGQTSVRRRHNRSEQLW